MVTEDTGNSAESAPTGETQEVTTLEEALAQIGTLTTQMSGLHRKNSSLDKRNKQLVAQVGESSLNAAPDRMEDAFLGLVDALGANPQFEEQKPQLEAIRNQVVQRKGTDASRAKTYGEINRLIEGFEGNEEDLNPVFEAIQANRLDEAETLARQLATTPSETDIEALVQEEVRKIIKVDTGITTATPGQKYTRQSISGLNMKNTSVEDMVKATDEVLDQAGIH